MKQLDIVHSKKIVIAITGLVVLLSLFLFSTYSFGKTVQEEPVITWVSHTEYWRNDHGSTIVRLSDYKGNPFPVDECRATILYPDKTVFVRDLPLVENEIIPGNWYRTDSLVGAQLGTYEQEVTCSIGNLVVKTAQSFHVNPALEQISVLTDKSDLLDASLENVRLDITGTIATTGEEINANLADVNTSVSSLISDTRNDLTQQLAEHDVSMESRLSAATVTINGTIVATGDEIRADLSDVNASLIDLITRLEQDDLSVQLTASFADLTIQISDVNAHISGKVDSTNELIDVRIEDLNSTMKTLIADLTDQVIAQGGGDINGQLSDVNVSLHGTIVTTGQKIETRVNDVNASLSALITRLVRDDLEGELVDLRADLVDRLTIIRSDTNWLVQNAVNQDDVVALNARFDSVESNLADVKAFCSTSATNTSVLCQEIESISVSIETMKNEQSLILDEINTTTSDTYALLSGDFATNIDTLLDDIGIIKQRTETIEHNTEQILNEIQGDVSIAIIS